MLMSKPFFSILMPVYNSAKFLNRSIDSILNQTYQDFELIIVDDCSTDGSADILADYLRKDKHIIVTRTAKNAGVANARNEGMKLVKGRYLTFVDSDDYIEITLLEKVKEVIDSTKAQLVKYSVVEQYYDKNQNLIGKKNVCLKDKLYTNPDEVRSAVLPMEKLPLFGYLWNSFYDLKTVTKHLWNFDTHMYVNEDFMMNIKIIDHIQRMACMSYIGYHYEKRVNSSLSTRQNEQYYESSRPKIEMLLKKYKIWGLLTANEKAEIYWLYIRIIYSTICRIITSSQLATAKDKLERIYNDDLFEVFYKDDAISKLYKGKEYIMYYLLKNKHTILVVFLCVMISFVKNKFQMFFYKIKD